MKSEVEEIAVFGAASEDFTQKNINCSIKESLERFQIVMDAAKEKNIKVRGYVSCVLGCPYSGEVDPMAVSETTKELFDMGCYEVSLGDTIGIGTPESAEKLFATLRDQGHDFERLASHFHDTYSRAIQNLVVSLANGVSVMDSSVSGIGGCPYAKGASGNVPTEDVLYLCDLLGIEHGVSLGKVIEVGDYISAEIEVDNLAKVKSEDLKLLDQRKAELFN